MNMPLVLLNRRRRGGATAFSPSTLFALAEPGVWFDPSDTATLFQDPAGTTPVTAPGQTVGLMLDKSRGLVASTKGGQMDGVVGGSFDTPSATANQITGDIDIRMRASLLSWTPAATTTLCSRLLTGANSGDSYEFWINTSGVLQLLTVSGTTATNVASSASVGFAAGTTNWVRVTWQQSTGFVNFYTSSDGVTWTQNGTANRAGTTSATNAGTRPLRFGARSDGASGSFPLNGKIYRAQIYNGINGTLAVDFDPTRYVSGATYTAATGEVWTITGLYARIVPDGSHATQATITARPTYSIEPVGGRRNIFTYSEQFENTTGWAVAAGVTVTPNTHVAPNGTLTADTLTSGGNQISSAFILPIPASTTYTSSVYFRKTTGATYTPGVYLFFSGGTSVIYAAVVNTNTGVPTASTAAGLTAPSGLVVTDAGDYWRLSISGSSTNNTELRLMIYPNFNVISGGAFAGSQIIWGAQLELGSTATAYQRVTTQHDVTEAGVASVGYLYFDGVNDAMVTSTITPGIDKAQVFAGVRKLSDAVAGVLLESSVNFGANSGSFYITAPENTGAAGNYAAASRGSTAVNANQIATSAVLLAPITSVLTATNDIAGDLSAIRVNGAASGTNATGDKGTGNFLAYPLYIGARGGASLPFTGHLYSLITRFGPTLDAPTIASTETWVAGKTGITI